MPLARLGTLIAFLVPDSTTTTANTMRMLKKLMFLAPLLLTATAFGQDEPPAEGTYEAFMAGSDAAMFTVNNLWILLSAA